MDVKERRPYCSLTKSRREKERRYTNSSADNEECRVPTQKSYSSSETLKAFDHDSSRLLYGNRVKDLVHREADEYSRQGQNFTLRQLGVCEPATRRGLAFCAEMGLPHRGYSISAGSDADTENEAVMSPEHAMRLWGRGVKSGRSSCLSSRSNSALTLTDTEHENKSDSENVLVMKQNEERQGESDKGLALKFEHLAAFIESKQVWENHCSLVIGIENDQTSGTPVVSSASCSAWAAPDGPGECPGLKLLLGTWSKNLRDCASRSGLDLGSGQWKSQLSPLGKFLLRHDQLAQSAAVSPLHAPSDNEKYSVIAFCCNFFPDNPSSS
ncbi:teneurin-3-like [Marmota flaviventris]|uniref:teneurin-3-like n=1 Tax=Marmota flaviventris TaxID=93162 RepID=UPI003A86EA09